MSALTACRVPFILYFILLFSVAPMSQAAGASPYTVLSQYVLGTICLTYSAYVCKRNLRMLYGLFGAAVFITASIATFTKVVGGSWPEWDRNTGIIISLVRGSFSRRHRSGPSRRFARCLGMAFPKAITR